MDRERDRDRDRSRPLLKQVGHVARGTSPQGISVRNTDIVRTEATLAKTRTVEDSPTDPTAPLHLEPTATVHALRLRVALLSSIHTRLDVHHRAQEAVLPCHIADARLLRRRVIAKEKRKATGRQRDHPRVGDTLPPEPTATGEKLRGSTGMSPAIDRVLLHDKESALLCR
ncbi:hypothetical protein LTR28_009751 [Elasticomyces elasticus]|nr:hypothetical protein LTR28_009751 [Elasticomyces elasticus]